MTDWRLIPGWDARYEVNEQGEVRSWAMWRGQAGPRLLSTYIDKHGYVRTGILREDGTCNRSQLVHHLVAAAFLGPRPDGLQIRHLDGDPSNPRAWNLAYGTASENQLDRVSHGTSNRGAACGNSRLTEAAVTEIRHSYTGAPGQVVAMAKQYGVSHPTISRVIHGQSWLGVGIDRQRDE